MYLTGSKTGELALRLESAPSKVRECKCKCMLLLLVTLSASLTRISLKTWTGTADHCIVVVNQRPRFETKTQCS